MMKNPVMNYNQFMSVFKSASNAYSKKANVASKDAKSNSSIKQELSGEVIKGKGTPNLDRHTKQYLANVKKKSPFTGKK
jgi:hypothetical protein